MNERGREHRIKFGLEIATLLTAIAALASVWLTYQQTRTSIEATRLAAYQQLTANSLEFDKALAEKDNAELRPYFKEGKQIERDDRLYNRVALLAEMQVDAIDAIIAYTLEFTRPSEVQTWTNTFHRSFRESPATCEFLHERQEQYHVQTVQLAESHCTKW